MNDYRFGGVRVWRKLQRLPCANQTQAKEDLLLVEEEYPTDKLLVQIKQFGQESDRNLYKDVNT